MNCKSCGAPLTPNTTFCPNCGTNNAMAQPSQPVQNVQPGYQAQPVQNIQPGYQVQPGQPVQPGYPTPFNDASANMPMTYHIVYMVLMAISVVMNIVEIIGGEQVDSSLLISLGLAIVMLIGLYQRKKFGRIIAIVYNVLMTIGGGLIVLAGLLFQDAFNSLGISFTGFGLMFALVGGGICAWGIATIVYYNKRKNMFK